MSLEITTKFFWLISFILRGSIFILMGVVSFQDNSTPSHGAPGLTERFNEHVKGVNHSLWPSKVNQSLPNWADEILLRHFHENTSSSARRLLITPVQFQRVDGSVPRSINAVPVTCSGLTPYWHTSVIHFSFALPPVPVSPAPRLFVSCVWFIWSQHSRTFKSKTIRTTY